MKVSSSVNLFLTNKYVLYFVLFLAFTNFVGYVMVGNLNAMLLFIIFGLMVSYFSKNMVVVLGSAILLTNLFALNINKKEGFDQPIDKPTKKRMNLHQKKRNTTIRSTCLIHQSRLPVKKRHTKINRQGLKLGDQKKEARLIMLQLLKMPIHN